MNACVTSCQGWKPTRTTLPNSENCAGKLPQGQSSKGACNSGEVHCCNKNPATIAISRPSVTGGMRFKGLSPEARPYDSPMMQSALSVEPAALDIAATGLSTSGYAVLSIAIDDELLLVLRTEGFSHRDALLPAATGRGDCKHTGRQRGDSTLWLDDAACGDASRRFLAGLEDLRRQLTGRLMLGINEVEAHYALYPPGAGYARHRDRFRDDDARVLSLVCYLNNDW